MVLEIIVENTSRVRLSAACHRQVDGTLEMDI